MEAGNVVKAMREGLKVSTKDIDAAIEIYKQMAFDFKEKDMHVHAERLSETIEQLSVYRSVKRRNAKPRLKSEIQESIDYALAMKHQCLAARQPAKAASWEYKLKEYETEYMQALAGKTYVPQIEGREEI